MIFSPLDEQRFSNWYLNLPINKDIANKGYEIPSPDDPQHFYDYRKAFMSGAMPGQDGHLPSEFKKMGHPRTVLNGMYTPDETIYGAQSRINELTGRKGLSDFFGGDE